MSPETMSVAIAFLPVVALAYFLSPRRLKIYTLAILSITAIVLNFSDALPCLAVLFAAGYGGTILSARIDGKKRFAVFATILSVQMAIVVYGGIRLPTTPDCLILSICGTAVLFYTVDVYRRTAQPQTDPFRFAAYMFFFPY